MLGRAAYQDTKVLAALEEHMFGTKPNWAHIFEQYKTYIETTEAPPQALLKPLFGLFHGMKNGRLARQLLSEEGRVKNKAELCAVFEKAIQCCFLEHLSTF